MLYLIGLWESVREFIATGGDVLYFVAAALFLMWALMIERYWYLTAVFPKVKSKIIADWDARKDTTSWYAHRIRDAWISQASDALNARLLIIRTLVAMCPLIGLLGTVTGMINVFETMATQGTSNARLMASGISMATIPTMAGMVAALSGLFVSSRIEAKAKIAKEGLVDSLPHHQREIDMGRKVREPEEEAAIDMTPMLDIVFIMLIFFIVTTVFVKEAGIEVNKPDASLAVLHKNANIFIAVTEDGDVWLDKRQVAVDSVRANIERLLTEQPTDYVIIQADVKAKHGLIVEIMDQVKDAGVERVSVAARGG